MSELQPEPPTFTPTRVKIPRFQMRLSDIFILFGFLGTHLWIWGRFGHLALIATVIVSFVLSWLFILFVRQQRLERGRFRTLKLILYLLGMSVPLNVGYAFMLVDYIKQDIQVRRNQDMEVSGFVLAIERVWHARDIAAATNGVLQPGARITSLKELNQLDSEIIQVECSNPAQNADKARPYHGYFIKLLKSNSSAQPGKVDPEVLRPSLPVVIYPANYSEVRKYSFVVTDEGTWIQKDWGPGTLEIISKMEVYHPNEWARK